MPGTRRTSDALSDRSVTEGVLHREVTTADKCLEVAANYKAEAALANISPRRASLLRNISRTYTALASQLAMLQHDMNADSRWTNQQSAVARHSRREVLGDVETI
jgi:hypothetical protein